MCVCVWFINGIRTKWISFAWMMRRRESSRKKHKYSDFNRFSKCRQWCHLKPKKRIASLDSNAHGIIILIENSLHFEHCCLFLFFFFFVLVFRLFLVNRRHLHHRKSLWYLFLGCNKIKIHFNSNFLQSWKLRRKNAGVNDAKNEVKEVE